MEGGSESNVSNDSNSNEIHVLKFNAAGVWSNVIVPPRVDISKQGASVTMTIDSTTSDVCLGLVAPGVAPMNCQPGNPVAFLTLMWNVSHNRVYFLNHPLVPIGAASAPGKRVPIAYFKHAPVTPGSTFTLAVDAGVKTIRGLQGETVCFTLTPVSAAIVHGLGAFGFGLALSGANDRVHVTSSFPLSASEVRGKPDTLAFGDSAASAQAPASAKRQMFDAVPVTVESVLPGFKVEPRYKGAAERRQHIEINEAYPGLQKIHSDPDIYEVQDFLTKEECEILMAKGGPHLIRSAVVGQSDNKSTNVTPSSGRTSKTCYFHRHHLKWLMAKAMALIPGKPVKHFELPQIARYLKTQKYDRHQDAFNLLTESGRQSCANGGQRVGTLLIYLNDVAQGGNTAFVNYNFRCAPKQGKAIVFFPCFADGVMDTRTLHAALPADDVKWVSQIWIRQANFEGTTGRPESSSDEEDDYKPPSSADGASSGSGGSGADAASTAEQ